MASLGEELRKQRELRQISLREISDATKINIRFLEALEKNDYTHLPGGQFNKGFIRAYARHIGVDSERMIEAYIEQIEPRTTPGGNPPAETASERKQPRRAAAAIVAMLILLTLVLAGGAVLAWMLKP